MEDLSQLWSLALSSVSSNKNISELECLALSTNLLSVLTYHAELLHHLPPRLWKGLFARCCQDDHILAEAVLSYHNHQLTTDDFEDEELSTLQSKGVIATLERRISMSQTKLASHRADVTIQLTTDLLKGLLQTSFLRYWISTDPNEFVMNDELDLVILFSKILLFTPAADLLGNGTTLLSISSKLRILAYDPTRIM
jgi:hypothetical protein